MYVNMFNFARRPAGMELFSSLSSLRVSVIPMAIAFALPSACLGLFLKVVENSGNLPEAIHNFEMMSNNAAYTGFSFAMGFLLIFRTSQSYSRFWEGVTSGHRMMAEWMDFSSAVVAFCKYSKASPEATQVFHHRLVRLMSILHGSALATLRGIQGSNFELIDIDGLDEEALDNALLSDHPTAIVGQWITELVMEGIEDKIIVAPPPIVSRCFQEFANGMVAYHDAMKVQTTMFPIHYTQLTAILLVAHWILTPIAMCQWVHWTSWVFCLTFIQVMFFWALYFTAVEIECPFKKGELAETHPATRIQKEFNHQLLLLISPKTRDIPKLSPNAQLDIAVLSGQHEERSLGPAERQERSPAIRRKSRLFGHVRMKQSISAALETVAAPVRASFGKDTESPRSGSREVSRICSSSSTHSADAQLKSGTLTGVSAMATSNQQLNHEGAVLTLAAVNSEDNLRFKLPSPTKTGRVEDTSAITPRTQACLQSVDAEVASTSGSVQRCL